jgi:predicted aspartyl protease
LGDGSEVTFEVYAATIIWDGQYRNIPVNEAETDPLVGMGLLYGNLFILLGYFFKLLIYLLQLLP